MKKHGLICCIILSLLLYPERVFAISSTNYKINDYGFGAGGTAQSTSTNFKLNGVAGEVENGRPASSNFKLGGGLSYEQQANVPSAPTVTNPSSYYNKLHIVINNGSNPTDATFLIAVSPDAFSTTTKYIAIDDTLTSSITSGAWQTYTNWGGASGFDLIGLTPGTTYTVKVSARQGNYTQSDYSPTGSAATSNPSLSFSVSPNSLNLTMTPTAITTSSTITVNLSTNGTAGGTVYIFGTNGGLLSSSTSYTITSASSDLSSVSQGYGAQGSSTSQSSGGPMEIESPYNGVGNNVGVLNATKKVIFDSTNAPVTTGQATFQVKAKPSATAKAASDYADTLTVLATAVF